MTLTMPQITALRVVAATDPVHGGLWMTIEMGQGPFRNPAAWSTIRALERRKLIRFVDHHVNSTKFQITEAGLSALERLSEVAVQPDLGVTTNV